MKNNEDKGDSVDQYSEKAETSQLENTVTSGNSGSCSGYSVHKCHGETSEMKSTTAREKLSNAVKAFIASHKIGASNAKNDQTMKVDTKIPCGEILSKESTGTNILVESKTLSAPSDAVSKPHKNILNIKSVIEKLLCHVDSEKQSKIHKVSYQADNEPSQSKQLSSGGAHSDRKNEDDSTESTTGVSDIGLRGTTSANATFDIETKETSIASGQVGSAIKEKIRKRRPVMTLYLKKTPSGQLILTEAVPAGKCPTKLEIKEPVVQQLSATTRISQLPSTRIHSQSAGQTEGSKASATPKLSYEHISGTGPTVSPPSENQPLVVSGRSKVDQLMVSGSPFSTNHPQMRGTPRIMKVSPMKVSPRAPSTQRHIVNDIALLGGLSSTHIGQSTPYSLQESEANVLADTRRIGVPENQIEACKIWARRTRHLFSNCTSTSSEADISLRQAYQWIRMSDTEKMSYIEEANRFQNSNMRRSQEIRVPAHAPYMRQGFKERKPNYPLLQSVPMHATGPNSSRMNSAVVSTNKGLFQLQNVVRSGLHPTTVTMRWRPIVIPTMTSSYRLPQTEQPPNLISIPDIYPTRQAMANFNPTFAKMMRCASYVVEHPNRFISDRFLRKVMSDDIYDMDDLLEDAERGIHWRFRGPDVVPNWLVNFIVEYETRQQVNVKVPRKNHSPAHDLVHRSSVESNKSAAATGLHRSMPEPVPIDSANDTKSTTQSERSFDPRNNSMDEMSVCTTNQFDSVTASHTSHTAGDRTTEVKDSKKPHSDGTEEKLQSCSELKKLGSRIDNACLNDVSTAIKSGTQKDQQLAKTKVMDNEARLGPETPANDEEVSEWFTGKSVTDTDWEQSNLDALGDIDLISEHSMWNLCVRLFPNCRRVRLWRDNIEELERCLQQLSQDDHVTNPDQSDSADSTNQHRDDFTHNERPTRCNEHDSVEKLYKEPVFETAITKTKDKTKSISAGQSITHSQCAGNEKEVHSSKGQADITNDLFAFSGSVETARESVEDQHCNKLALNEESVSVVSEAESKEDNDVRVSGSTQNKRLSRPSEGQRSLVNISSEKSPENNLVKAGLMKIDAEDELLDGWQIIDCPGTEKNLSSNKNSTPVSPPQMEGVESPSQKEIVPYGPLPPPSLNSNVLRISNSKMPLAFGRTPGLSHVEYEDIPSCSNDFTYGKPISMRVEEGSTDFTFGKPIGVKVEADKGTKSVKKKWKLRIVCPSRKLKTKSPKRKASSENNRQERKQVCDVQSLTTCHEKKESSEAKNSQSTTVCPLYPQVSSNSPFRELTKPLSNDIGISACEIKETHECRSEEVFHLDIHTSPRDSDDSIPRSCDEKQNNRDVTIKPEISREMSSPTGEHEKCSQNAEGNLSTSPESNETKKSEMVNIIRQHHKSQAKLILTSIPNPDDAKNCEVSPSTTSPLQEAGNEEHFVAPKGIGLQGNKTLECTECVICTKNIVDTVNASNTNGMKVNQTRGESKEFTTDQNTPISTTSNPRDMHDPVPHHSEELETSNKSNSTIEQEMSHETTLLRGTSVQDAGDSVFISLTPDEAKGVEKIKSSRKKKPKPKRRKFSSANKPKTRTGSLSDSDSNLVAESSEPLMLSSSRRGNENPVDDPDMVQLQIHEKFKCTDSDVHCNTTFDPQNEMNAKEGNDIKLQLFHVSHAIRGGHTGHQLDSESNKSTDKHQGFRGEDLYFIDTKGTARQMGNLISEGRHEINDSDEIPIRRSVGIQTKTAKILSRSVESYGNEGNVSRNLSDDEINAKKNPESAPTNISPRRIQTTAATELLSPSSNNVDSRARDGSSLITSFSSTGQGVNVGAREEIPESGNVVESRGGKDKNLPQQQEQPKLQQPLPSSPPAQQERKDPSSAVGSKRRAPLQNHDTTSLVEEGEKGLNLSKNSTPSDHKDVASSSSSTRNRASCRRRCLGSRTSFTTRSTNSRTRRKSIL